MNWLKKNWLWLLVIGLVLFFVMRAKAAYTKSPGGTVNGLLGGIQDNYNTLYSDFSNVGHNLKAVWQQYLT